MSGHDCIECKWSKIGYEEFHCLFPLIIPKAFEKSNFPVPFDNEDECLTFDPLAPNPPVENQGQTGEKR